MPLPADGAIINVFLASNTRKIPAVCPQLATIQSNMLRVHVNLLNLSFLFKAVVLHHADRGRCCSTVM